MFPKIENYTIRREIGTGGMAVVYEATDERLHRTVAIKILHPHLSKEQSASDRFLREARAAAKIDHPNVVRIYDFGERADLSYIVMEYVPGTNAETILKEKGPFPTESVIGIMVEIATALAQAHAQGMIHRDIKPGNILLHKQGRAMLTDFGLAHRLPDPRLTSENAVAGTPSFMAPEQLVGKPLSPAADIYSWAVCFYTLVTGILPYKAQEFPDVLGEIRHGAVALDSGLLTKLPAWCFELLHRCLCADPKERLQDARELLHYIAAVGKGITLSNSSLSAISIESNSNAAETPAATVVLPRGDSGKRSRLPQIAVTVIFIAVVSAGVIIIRMNTDDAVGTQTETDRAATENNSSEKAVTEPSVHLIDSIFEGESPQPEDTGIVQEEKTVLNPEDGMVLSSLTTIPAPADARNVVRTDTGKTTTVVDSGKLFVYCNPWAEVFIGEKKIGTTPLPEPVSLPVGEYHIRLVNTFCEPLADTVTVTADKVVRKRYSLKVRK